MDEMFFGFPPLPSALKQLVGLDDSQFGVFSKSVEKFGLDRGLERCKEISNEMKGHLDPNAVFNILGSIRFLYDRCRDWEKSDGEYKSQLREFLELTGIIKAFGEDFEKIGYARLDKLVAKNRTVERNRKVRWLRTGLLDTAIDFSSRIDLRPRISEDRKELEELIPVVVLRIVTESDSGEKKSNVFQLNKDGVNQLQLVLVDIEKKLEVLTSDSSISPRMISVPKK